MITSVHRQDRVIDQWSGEAFESVLRFKIPVQDGKKWKGCYATPSTALAALKAHISDNLKDKPDQQTLLMDLFHGSLRRKVEDPKYNGFVVQAAPHYTELFDFGGNLALDAYHLKYGHDLQRRLYFQEIPKLSQADDEGGQEAAAAAAAEDDAPSGKWHSRCIGTSASALEAEQTQALPRCVKGWIDFLREFAAVWTSCPDAVTVYFSKKDKYCFALGPPTAYFKKSNPQTSSYFDTPVYGSVTVYKHAAIKMPGEEKRKKSKSKEKGKDKKDEEDKAPAEKKQKTETSGDVEPIETDDDE